MKGKKSTKVVLPSVAYPKFAGKWKTSVPIKAEAKTLVVPQGSVRRPDECSPAIGKYEAGFAPKHNANTYTGEKVVGIATMHKSCLQPVFSQQEAEDSAKMRRN